MQKLFCFCCRMLKLGYCSKKLYSLQNNQFCTLDVVFEAVRCMYTPPTVATPKKLHIDSLNKQERVSPSLYGHYNTIVFQCFNTNSKRSLSPLFFHRETQQTRDRMHWCIDHWFSDPSILWPCSYFGTNDYKTHTTCIECLCQSKPTKKKKKRFEWAKKCRFCTETREMTCCVLLWWPLLVGWWEKPA